MEWEKYAHGRDKGVDLSRIVIWKQVEKTTGVTQVGLLNRVRCPIQLEYIYALFITLKSGCDKITYSEILAYQTLSRITFSRYVLNLIIKTESILNADR